MKKSLRKLLLGALAVVLTMALFVPAMASELDPPAKDYTYTIRVYAGAQGSVTTDVVALASDSTATVAMLPDNTGVIVTGLQYGERVNLTRKFVTVNNKTKYYFYDFTMSGKDAKNEDDGEYQKVASIAVTADRDYLCSYAMLGSSVEYTIRYIDAEGNRLAADETYYGNVGDKPVVAFLYIEGYIPQAYNLTGQLDKDPAKNIFTFIYTPVDDTEEDEVITVPSSGTDDEDETKDPSKSTDEDEDETIEGEGEDETIVVIVDGDDSSTEIVDDDADGKDDSADGDGDGTDEDGKDPSEIEDIDENRNPLSQFTHAVQQAVEEMAENMTALANKVKALPVAAKVGLISAAVLLLGGLVWLLLFFILKKKKKKEETPNE